MQFSRKLQRFIVNVISYYTLNPTLQINQNLVVTLTFSNTSKLQGCADLVR